MKSKPLIIATLLVLDAALTWRLPHDNAAAIGTAIVLTMLTALSYHAVLGRA